MFGGLVRKRWGEAPHPNGPIAAQGGGTGFNLRGSSKPPVQAQRAKPSTATFQASKLPK